MHPEVKMSSTPLEPQKARASRSAPTAASPTERLAVAVSALLAPLVMQLLGAVGEGASLSLSLSTRDERGMKRRAAAGSDDDATRASSPPANAKRSRTNAQEPALEELDISTKPAGDRQADALLSDLGCDEDDAEGIDGGGARKLTVLEDSEYRQKLAGQHARYAEDGMSRIAKRLTREALRLKQRRYGQGAKNVDLAGALVDHAEALHLSKEWDQGDEYINRALTMVQSIDETPAAPDEDVPNQSDRVAKLEEKKMEILKRCWACLKAIHKDRPKDDQQPAADQTAGGKN